MRNTNTNTNRNLGADLCARTDTVLRTRHYSRLTTKAYIFWIHFLQQYWFCTPDDLGESEVTAFLSTLHCGRTCPRLLRTRP